ncbi:aspartyl-phosphate phosphatase Spo0E family protein [Anaerobacillus sp. MEB173]|uniref:aspartyl-phosphate phosphatase Spo0E family protein n=1 Tax=Anaerobacillus sp. MEB173 TaxID=3383345 RepID=UPI003F928EE2
MTAVISFIDELKQTIEMKRKEMIVIAGNKGFTHNETVSISQEIDILLNRYQLLMISENK